MSIDEQEVRRRLAEAAEQASPPIFTAEGLVRRIRRRRTRIIAVVSGAFLAAVAIAVAIPVSLSGASRPAISQPAVIPVQPSFTVTVNGQSGAYGTVPLFGIASGEDIMVNVEVTVPAHATLEALWVGIASGAWGSGPNGPTGVNPILAASTRTPLGPGVHQFKMYWVAPAGLQHGAIRQLVAEWAIRDGTATRAIALFFVR